jgi:hypothetical protein
VITGKGVGGLYGSGCLGEGDGEAEGLELADVVTCLWWIRALAGRSCSRED